MSLSEGFDEGGKPRLHVCACFKLNIHKIALLFKLQHIAYS
jgi:hypothetical protein